MAIRKGRTVWKHAAGVYRRHTLLHPTHALVLTVPVFIGILTALDMVIAMIGLLIAELFIVVQVPRLSFVRRAIEARMERRVRVAASVVRGDLLQRMSEEHQRELSDLESVAASIRERCGTGGQPDDGLGVERLIELYVRFAIAHRAMASSLEQVGRARPDEAIMQLEQRRDVSSDLVRASIERRLAVIRMRCDARRAAHEQQEAIGHELAAIGDTLRWMHEHCASAMNEALRAELEMALRTRERDAATLRELYVLRQDRFDAEVIPLGRDPDAVSHGAPRVRIAPPPRHEQEETLCAVPEPLPGLIARRA